MEKKILILTTNVLHNDDLDGTLHFYKSFVNLHYQKLGYNQSRINFNEKNPAFKFQKEIVAKIHPDKKFEARNFFNGCSNYDVIIVLYDSGDDIEIEINFYDKTVGTWEVESFEDLADDSWLEESEIDYVKRKMEKFFNAYMEHRVTVEDLQDIYLTNF